MDRLRASPWGPQPLPTLLIDQLADHGFSSTDASRCADQIRTCEGAVARASLFVDLGACKFLEGDIDGAISSWRHSIASGHEASASRALVNLGLLYEHLHLHSQAVGVLSGVVERAVEPHATKAALAMARCQWALDQTEEAMETMARLAQATMVRRPDSETLAETLFGLGEIAEASGRTDRAERAWRVAVAGPSSDAQRAASDRLVPLLLSLENDYELIEVLERQPEQYLAAHAPALLDRIEWLARNNRNDQAASLARSVVGENLTFNDRFRLADTRLNVGLVNEAIDEYEVLLSSDDGDVRRRAAYSLGEVYRTYSMDDAAISLYGQVVADGDPFWGAKAAVPLGDLLARIDQIDVAVELWTSSAKSDVAAISHAAQERLAAVTKGRTAEAEAAAAARAARADRQAAADRIVAEQAAAAKQAAAAEQAAAAKQAATQKQAAAQREQAASPTIHITSPNRPAPTPQPAPPSEPVVVVLASIEDDEAIDETDAVDQIAEDAADDIDRSYIDSLNDTRGFVVEIEGLDASPPPSPADEDIDDSHDDLGDPDFVDPLNQTDDLYADELIDLVDEPFGTQHVPNPYAALAPDGFEADVAPSSRNPYAELAPNYEGDRYSPRANVETGDWESMLEAPERADDIDTSTTSNTSPSAFSRYT